MDVTLPNGQVIQGVPDGTTRAQLAEKLRGNGMDVPQEWMGEQKPSRDFFSTQTLKDTGSALMQQTKDALGGAVRGAGSIGATILSPIDAAARAMNDGKPINVGGYDIAGQDRRAAMGPALQQLLGSNPESMTYGAGKLASEVAGVSGVGGVLGGVASKVPMIPAALQAALRTSGMSAGGATGLGGMAARVVGGAATGGAAAGLVNPEDAGMGAAVGGVLPPALAVGGKVGQGVGRMFRGPEQTPDVAAAIQAARTAGYVIPPSQARPSLGNRMLEGLSGKITTAQNASARNQAITNAKAAAAVGLPTDRPITADSLKAVRDAAGQAYDALGQVGTVRPGQAYNDALDNIVKPHLVAHIGFPNAKPSPVVSLVDSLRSDVFDAASAVAKVKELRNAADDAFRTGNTDIARASRSAAKALEDALEAHLQSTGNTQALQSFRDARQLIAKTYSVEKALNPTTGTIDARKLGQQITKGKPLTGDLLAAGNFANRFPKAAQPIDGMGSLPQTSPLDWAMGGGLAMGTGNPLMLASMAARPAARASILSPMVQDRLLQGPGLMPALNPDLGLLGYRAAPLLMGDR